MLVLFVIIGGGCSVGLFVFLFGLFLKPILKSRTAVFSNCYSKVITQPLSQLPHILNKLIMSTWQLPVVDLQCRNSKNKNCSYSYSNFYHSY